MPFCLIVYLWLGFFLFHNSTTTYVIIFAFNIRWNIYFVLRFIIVYKKSLKGTFKPTFCVLVLLCHIKAFWYKKRAFCIFFCWNVYCNEKRVESFGIISVRFPTFIWKLCNFASTWFSRLWLYICLSIYHLLYLSIYLQ